MNSYPMRIARCGFIFHSVFFTIPSIFLRSH
nr:MAG TPA: hypothetical protein [Caudoviricetes sp.]